MHHNYTRTRPILTWNPTNPNPKQSEIRNPKFGALLSIPKSDRVLYFSTRTRPIHIVFPYYLVLVFIFHKFFLVNHFLVFTMHTLYSLLYYLVLDFIFDILFWKWIFQYLGSKSIRLYTWDDFVGWFTTYRLDSTKFVKWKYYKHECLLSILSFR